MAISKLIGAIGLLSISYGVVVKGRASADRFYVAGGILLLAYSIAIRDAIFIILQVVFILSALYDLRGRRRA